MFKPHRLGRYTLCACLLFMLAGCTNSMFSSSSTPPSPDPYYNDFTDIPIPKAMEVDGGETSVAYGQGGQRTGVQLYKGRVEVSSLTSAMGSNMTRDGWTLRSALRAANSVLVFEKPDRFCVLHIHDGWWNTEMRVFVTPKLTAGDVAFPAPATAAPATPAYSSGEKMQGVESYPAGGFSNQSSVQPLAN